MCFHSAIYVIAELPFILCYFVVKNKLLLSFYLFICRHRLWTLLLDPLVSRKIYIQKLQSFIHSQCHKTCNNKKYKNAHVIKLRTTKMYPINVVQTPIKMPFWKFKNFFFAFSCFEVWHNMSGLLINIKKLSYTSEKVWRCWRFVLRGMFRSFRSRL